MFIWSFVFFWRMYYVSLLGGMTEGLSSLWNQVCCRDPQWGGRPAWQIQAQSRALQRSIGSVLDAVRSSWLSDSTVLAQQESVWVQLGWCTAITGSLCCSGLPLSTKSSIGSLHCWQQRACLREDAASRLALSSRLCSPEKSLDNLILRSL